MKMNKMSLFFKIYISVVSFFVVLLIAAAVVLWTVLDAYETTRPKHVAQKVFDDYFVTAKVGALVEEYSSIADDFETAESINAGVSANYDTSKFEYFPVTATEENSERFAVTCEGEQIAYFTVSLTDKKASYGFKYYELSEVEVFFGSYGDISVKVPKGYTLTVNGKTVADRYISSADIESTSCKYMPDDTVKGIMYDIYTVSGLVFEPQIEVTAPNGEKATVEFNSDEDLYEVGIVYDKQLESEQSAYVIAAATEYTKYLSNDAPFTSIAAYLDPKATIYKRVDSVEVEWVRPHTYKITDEKAEEFYKYADGVYSCHVSLKLTMMQSGEQDFEEFIDLTLYLHKVGGKYLIYEMIIN